MWKLYHDKNEQQLIRSGHNTKGMDLYYLNNKDYTGKTIIIFFCFT